MHLKPDIQALYDDGGFISLRDVNFWRIQGLEISHLSSSKVASTCQRFGLEGDESSY
ncbi:MAG: hypothetical protein R2865_09255 [Deinococcales bacterium]